MEFFVSEEPACAVGNTLNELLAEYKDIPVLLLLSGGSAFAILEYVDLEVLSEDITLSMLDERYSSDPSVNNFMQLSQTDFFASAKEQGVQMIDTRISKGEGREALAERWESELRDWADKNPNGKVIATIGIGEDGHTAGIMINVADQDFNTDSWVISYTVPADINQYTERITITFTFLREKIDEALVYMVGEKKRKALESINSSEGNTTTTPARILREMHSVQIYTDISLK